MVKLLSYIQAYTKNEDGATAIEYGLIAAGIAVVISAAVFAFGDELNTLFESLGGSLAAAE
jgi:pilus assembly protein Flp/PilA